jgi:hypothetical protein
MHFDGRPDGRCPHPVIACEQRRRLTDNARSPRQELASVEWLMARRLERVGMGATPHVRTRGRSPRDRSSPSLRCVRVSTKTRDVEMALSGATCAESQARAERGRQMSSPHQHRGPAISEDRPIQGGDRPRTFRVGERGEPTRPQHLFQASGRRPFRSPAAGPGAAGARHLLAPRSPDPGEAHSPDRTRP